MLSDLILFSRDIIMNSGEGTIYRAIDTHLEWSSNEKFNISYFFFLLLVHLFPNIRFFSGMTRRLCMCFSLWLVTMECVIFFFSLSLPTPLPFSLVIVVILHV